MSENFVMFRAPPGGNLADLIRGSMSETIGSVTAVQASLQKLLPGLQWQLLTEALSDSSQVTAWLGVHTGGSELQLLVEPDGQVRMIHLADTTREEVEHLIEALQLVAFDEKSLDVLGGTPAIAPAAEACSA